MRPGRFRYLNILNGFVGTYQDGAWEVTQHKDCLGYGCPRCGMHGEGWERKKRPEALPHLDSRELTEGVPQC